LYIWGFDARMNDAAIGVIGTLGGTFLGFLLSTIENRWREQRTERKQVQSIRLLIGLEIQQNLELLEHFWEDVIQLESQEILASGDAERLHYAYAYRVTQKPPLIWSYNAWESQMAMLPIALEAREIRQVQNFYQRLRDISTIHSFLVNLLSQDEADRRDAQSLPRRLNSIDAMRAMTNGVFIRKASSFGKELEEVVQDVLGRKDFLTKTFIN
jgi:hypothetical protein